MSLTAEQKDVVLASTAELIAAAAAGRAPAIADPSLAGAYGQTVAGVFVTLKRGRHLRGCTGGLKSRPVLLGESLVDAVEGTVHRDVRFPPISIGEVAHLDLDVWLLSEPEPVTETGEDRLRAVEVGRHGLVMNRGDKHGLLLPGVPVEHGWDARTFLEQTCVKAGLHPSQWKDDATALLRFGGESFGGPLNRWLRLEEAPPFTDRTELGGFYDFCWDNIVATMQGATPRYFHPGLRDLRVSGAIVRLRLPGNRGEFQLAQISLRPALHAQNLLLQMGQSAAAALAQRGVHVGNLGLVGMGLTLLGDPHLLGTVRDHGDFEAGRAILVSERQRQALVHQPESTGNETLSRALESAQVQHPEHAILYSLQAFTTDRSVVFSNVPRPRRGPADRPSAVAGAFYPVDPNALAQMVDDLLARSKEAAPPKRPVAAAMVPHAGLRFSGLVAAQVLQSIELTGRILVLGPKHTPHGMDWAVAPHEKWRLPGGEIASDFMLARKLSQSIPGLEMDANAHEKEHAIEVELPFLAKLAPQSRVIGIALGGDADWPSACRFAEGLERVIRSLPEPPLLLISSDMNHFATDAETRRLDAIALEALERLDPEAALGTIRGHNISMCGVFPAVIVMETLRRLGRLTKATRCGYATSADTTGEKDRVVGYAGMLFE
jgi:AmmeMemoRadiSam system protein B/AmmeMemoRadiSam system protein A